MRSLGPVTVMAVILLVVVPLCYVLSAGPAVWLYAHGALGPSGYQVVETIYCPLEWAASKTEVIGTPLTWYVHLWTPAIERPVIEPLPAPATSYSPYASPVPAAATSQLPPP
jgi:hypothetical protein